MNDESLKTEKFIVYDLEDFLIQVGKYQNQGYIFRGLDNCEYDPIPSLIFKDKSNGYAGIENEISIYEALFSKCCVMNLDKISILEIARHYDFNCRFVDYSVNPLVSLYFACKENSDNDSKIICFNLPLYSRDHECLTREGRSLSNQQLIDVLINNIHNDFHEGTIFIKDDEDYYQFSYPLPIRPIIHDSRINAQQGMFLMWFNLSMEDELIIEELNKYTSEILIDKDSKEAILKELESLGYTKANIENPFSDHVKLYFNDEEEFKGIINNLNSKMFSTN